MFFIHSRFLKLLRIQVWFLLFPPSSPVSLPTTCYFDGLPFEVGLGIQVRRVKAESPISEIGVVHYKL